MLSFDKDVKLARVDIRKYVYCQLHGNSGGITVRSLKRFEPAIFLQGKNIETFSL